LFILFMALVVVGLAIKYWYVVVPVVAVSLLLFGIVRSRGNRRSKALETTDQSTAEPTRTAGSNASTSSEVVEADGGIWTEDELSVMRVVELRATARDFGIKTSGLNKAELIAAILNSDDDDDDDDDDDERSQALSSADERVTAAGPQDPVAVSQERLWLNTTSSGPDSPLPPPPPPPPAVAQPHTVPASWVADPTDPTHIAFWDGGQYTTHKRWTGATWVDV